MKKLPSFGYNQASKKWKYQLVSFITQSRCEKNKKLQSTPTDVVDTQTQVFQKWRFPKNNGFLQVHIPIGLHFYAPKKHRCTSYFASVCHEFCNRPLPDSITSHSHRYVEVPVCQNQFFFSMCSIVIQNIFRVSATFKPFKGLHKFSLHNGDSFLFGWCEGTFSYVAFSPLFILFLYFFQCFELHFICTSFSSSFSTA